MLPTTYTTPIPVKPSMPVVHSPDRYTPGINSHLASQRTPKPTPGRPAGSTCRNDSYSEGEDSDFVYVKVDRPTLRNAVGNGLHHRNVLLRLLRTQVTVRVEAQPNDRTDSVFYAPFADDGLGESNSNMFGDTIGREGNGVADDEGAQSQSTTFRRLSDLRHRSASAERRERHSMSKFDQRLSWKERRRSRNRDTKYKKIRPPMKTEFVAIDPVSSYVPHMCLAEDDFEISFVGMSIPQQDTFSTNGNELLLYSLRNHVYPDEESDSSDDEQNTSRTSFAQLRVSDALLNSIRLSSPSPIQHSYFGERSNSIQSNIDTPANSRENMFSDALLHAREHEDDSDDNEIEPDRSGMGSSDGCGEEIEKVVNPNSRGNGIIKRKSVTFSVYDQNNQGRSKSLTTESTRSGLRQYGPQRDREHSTAVVFDKKHPYHARASQTRQLSHKTPKRRNRQETCPVSVKDPNGINLLPTDVPLIHYDPVIDGHNTGTLPNSFVVVPASKALFRQHHGHANGTRLIPIRFTVMEIDRISAGQAQAISQIDSVQGFASQSGVAVPYADVVSAAVNVVNAVGKRAIKKYSRPDHVLSKDFEFRLAEASQLYENRSSKQPLNGKRPQGDRRHKSAYLRYGYYFFLSEPIDAKLYAQTDASSQNVPLLLRRYGFTKRMAQRGEKEFFPLSGVGYVVIRVTPGCTKQPRERTRAFAMENRARLEHILHVNNALEILAEIK